MIGGKLTTRQASFNFARGKKKDAAAGFSLASARHVTTGLTKDGAAAKGPMAVPKASKHAKK